MPRTLFASVLACVLPLVAPTIQTQYRAVAQESGLELNAEYQSALHQLANELKREFDLDADMLDDKKLLQHMKDSGVNECLMKIWRRSIEESASDKERYEFAVAKTNDLKLRIELVENYLKSYSGSDSLRRSLAVRIARDADSTADVFKQVLPTFDKYLGNGKGNFSNGLELARTLYDEAFESICAKATKDSLPERDVDYGPSVLQSNGGDYSSRKPVVTASAPSPSIQSVQPTIADRIRMGHEMIRQGKAIHPRVVSSEGHLCSSAKMIYKCYDFYVDQDQYGRRRLFHGNLYADCTGYILVEHQKR